MTPNRNRHLFEQARLEYLRAQTLLLQAQAYALTHGEPGKPRPDLFSMMGRILDPNASSNDAVPVNLPEAQ